VKKIVDVVIERDEDGYYIASVPQLQGCHTQARTMDELLRRMREAVELYLDVEKGAIRGLRNEFVGIQRIEITS